MTFPACTALGQSSFSQIVGTIYIKSNNLPLVLFPAWNVFLNTLSLELDLRPKFLPKFDQMMKEVK